MSIARLLVAGVVFAGACTDPPNPSPDEDTPGGTLVDARTGGVVTSGDVSLVVPPGSLPVDTSIAIVSEIAAPDAYTDGFAASGGAFRFTPAGTHFALDKPALLTMPFDEAALAAQGLDSRTLQLAYYDEELGRYLSVGGEIDPVTRTVTAKIEHFTIYQPIAASLVAGNNAPTIAPQGTIPSVMRGRAPAYFRALIRDYDSGGSVAGAFLHYRVQQGPWQVIAMKPEATLDVFGATLPASAMLPTPQGEDLRYYFSAVDNLGATRSTAEVTVWDTTSSYVAGTLAISPGAQNIAAGFERVFAVTGRDTLGATFALVPETATLAQPLGETVTGTTGVTFKARNVGTTALTVGFGADSANANVTVFNGALASIAILDEHGMPFTGTPDVRTGVRIPLTALGHDAWGNTIVVNPTWSLSQTTGVVSPEGVLDTLDASGSLRVNAEIGAVTGTQWFNVTPRSVTEVLSHDVGRRRYTRLASSNGVPFAAYLEGDPWSIRVARFDGSSWIALNPPTTTLDVQAIAIAANDDRVQIAWVEGNHVHSAHLEGSSFVVDGGPLAVDDVFSDVNWGPTALSVAIDDSNDAPWLAWSESTGGIYNTYVARWTGSAWAVVGGRVGGSHGSVDPSLIVVDGVPSIAYTDVLPAPDYAWFIVVRTWNGSDWVALGDPQTGGFTEQASLVRYRDKLTIVFRTMPLWDESHIDVRQWNGTAWSEIGAPITFSAFWKLVGRVDATSDNRHLYIGANLMKSGTEPISYYEVLHHSPSTSSFTRDHASSAYQPPTSNDPWTRDIDVAMIGNALYFSYALPAAAPNSFEEIHALR